MINTQHVEVTPVYYHDCRALGPQARLIRALMADKDGEHILGQQLKCPFCLFTAGEFVLAPGVTRNPSGGYLVDTTIATKLRSHS